jgi:AcrR family transcriptional regulator
MTSNKMPRRGDSAETRARILNAALALFRKQGFEQTTMRQIAAESGMALGAAYYYFPSKEALVMAFYERAQEELTPLLHDALNARSLERRLSALLEVKFRYFQPNRSLLGALSRHIDPRHPLSPFSDETRLMRDKDIQHFVEALEGSSVRVPPDLKVHLPRLLWLYQMGLLLFWVYDSSQEQVRTKQLVEKSLSLVALLIKFANFPLFRPIRRRVVGLLTTVSREPSPANRREET